MRSTSSSGCRGVDLGHLVEFLADDLAGVGLGALLEPPIEDQLPAFQYGAARGSGSAALSSFPRLGFEAEIGLLLCIGANVRVGRVFERRFRDIHTLAQQIQSRDAHYETVGQVLLGNPPEVFFYRVWTL